MEHTTLGRGGPRISRIGFGCATIGGHDYGAVRDETSVAAILRALDLGINFFDVADVYGLGRAETVLGSALKGRLDNVVIATKVGVRWDAAGQTTRDLSAAWMERALRDSLRRLGTDHIPLYQVHWPDGQRSVTEVMERMLAFRHAGHIGDIGCCNFSAAQVAEAATVVPLASLQLPLSLVEREHRALAASAAAAYGVSVLTYNVLGRGLLTGKYTRESTFTGTDTRARSDLFRGPLLEEGLQAAARLAEVAARHGRTPSEAAVRWVLQQEGVGVALTGIKSPEQAESNAAAAEWSLDADDLRYLEPTRSE